jgi:hypothetical protein
MWQPIPLRKGTILFRGIKISNGIGQARAPYRCECHPLNTFH